MPLNYLTGGVLPIDCWGDPEGARREKKSKRRYT